MKKIYFFIFCCIVFVWGIHQSSAMKLCTEEQHKHYIDTVIRSSGTRDRFIVVPIKFLDYKGTFIITVDELIYSVAVPGPQFHEAKKKIRSILTNNDTLVLDEPFGLWRTKKFFARELIRVPLVDEIAECGEEYFLQYFFNHLEDKTSPRIKTKKELFGSSPCTEKQYYELVCAVRYYVCSFCIFCFQEHMSGTTRYIRYSSAKLIKTEKGIDIMESEEKYK